MVIALNYAPDAGTIETPITTEEWSLRVDLAGAYRLAAMHQWNDLIYTHISARVSGLDDVFLLNPLGLRFDEIKASDFLRVDLEGRSIDPTPHRIHTAGYVVHSAVHAARPDVGCIIHCHTPAGMAVSAMKEGLLPLSQIAMMFYGHTGYHESEGIVLDLDERARLAADLGQNDILILRNHGLLVTGATVAEAYSRMYFLDQACQAQVAMLASGRDLTYPAPGVAESIAAANRQKDENGLGNPELYEWPAMLRLLDKMDPGFRE